MCDTKNSTGELIQLTNTFIKTDGYIINLEKIVVHLYANVKWIEKEIRESALFTIASNNTKCVG